MVYKIKVTTPKGKFTIKELKFKKALATLYASSPYITKKSKDKFIKGIFK